MQKSLIHSYRSKQEALTNAGLLLGRRQRRRANINPALGQGIVFVETVWNSPLAPPPL